MYRAASYLLSKTMAEIAKEAIDLYISMNPLPDAPTPKVPGTPTSLGPPNLTFSSPRQPEQLATTISVLERIEIKLDGLIANVADTETDKDAIRRVADFLAQTYEEFGPAKKKAQRAKGIARKRGKRAAGGTQ